MKKKSGAPRGKKGASEISARLVGRSEELGQIRACLRANRNVLLEGPVGVGKTHLALAVTRELGRPVFRVDGDSRYSEQKLSGWFDPPAVVKKGFVASAFMAGPLVEAMRVGGVLFINELNRLPEGVQNVLLPAIDERMVSVPRLGVIQAKPGFLVVATQNPKEFVATSHLSEAILDRFELVGLDYQSEEDELAITRANVAQPKPGSDLDLLAQAAVLLARLTRGHERIKRGASVRAAIATAEIGAAFLADGLGLDAAFLQAALLAFPTRIEIERDAESGRDARSDADSLLRQWAGEVLEQLRSGEKKKN